MDYKQKLIKKMIILCWIILTICMVLKLFCADLFQINVYNERFIDLCNFIDNNIVIKLMTCYFISFFSIGLFILAILQCKWFNKTWNIILFIITILVGVPLKLYNQYIGFIFDFWQMFIFPCILIGKPSFKYINIIIGNILIILFQIMSMYIKNINIGIMENTLLSIIFSIDYYILLTLYYLYANLIGGNMGAFGAWFMSKNVTQLKAFRATLKDNSKIAIKVDDKIAKLENNNKTN